MIAIRVHVLVSETPALILGYNGSRIPGAPSHKTKLISQTTQIPKTLDLSLPLQSLLAPLEPLISIP